jgi:hypothetical protein
MATDQDLQQRLREMELELEVLRTRSDGPPYKRWQLQLYVFGVLAVGFIIGFWAINDSSRFIPELVNDAAPVMLVLSVSYYAYTRWELSVQGQDLPAVGNWYLASFVLVAQIFATGWLLVDKARPSIEVVLIADLVMLIAILAHPVISIGRRQK